MSSQKSMHLSEIPFCCLCASLGDDASFTKISSEKGKRENLRNLLDQYIVPTLFLSKDNNLCLCDTCKKRLIEWDTFIKSCKHAQERLKDSLKSCDQAELPTNTKSEDDSISRTVALSVVEASPPKKKKSSNYCIAQWCNQGNYQGASLFRLPRERERALLWLKEAERSDLNCKNTLHSYYLCANHFTEDMFTNKARNKLVRTAIPTVFPKTQYADKIALKAAASQIFPTQFKGVPLKSILPKVSVSNSVLPTTYKNVVVKASANPKPARKLKTTSVRLSSEGKLQTLSASDNHIFGVGSLTSHESVIGITNPAPVLPNVETVQPTENFHIYSSSSAFTTEPCASNRLFCVVKPSSPLNSDSAAVASSCLAESSAPITKVQPSSTITKEHKQTLEEIESCLVSGSFNSSPLIAGQDLKTTSMPFLKQTFQGESSSYKTIVGSQDFLLPHISENITKSSSFTDQSYSLRSDDPVQASDSSNNLVPRESNPILNHNNELNSPHIDIFDLPSDIPEAESSFINNIDEFMELDKYFEG